MLQFLTSARELRIRILSRSYFAVGETDFTTSISETLATGARIFVFYMSAEDMSNLLLAGSAAGLFNEGSQIIASDPVVLKSSWSSSTRSEVAAVLKGVIGFTTSTLPDYSSKKAKQFLVDYLSQTNTTPDPRTYVCNLACDETGKDKTTGQACNYLHQRRMNPGSVSTAYYNCTGTNFTALKRDGSDIDAGALRTYDAVWMMAIAMQTALNMSRQLRSNGGNTAGNLFRALIDNSTYNGATGYINFSNDRTTGKYRYGEGDRITGLRYNIMNFNPTAYIEDLSDTGGFQIVGTWSVEKKSNFTSFVTYNTIDNSVPIDSPPRVVLSMSRTYRVILLALGIILIIFTELISLIIWSYRKKKLLKSLQLKMQYLILVGSLLGGVRVISGSLVVSNRTCSMNVWLGHLCFWFMFLPIAMKTWRIHKIVNSKSLKRVIISENMILKAFCYVIINLLLYLALMQSFYVSTPIKVTHSYEVGIYPFTDYKCSSRTPGKYGRYVQFYYFFIILCLLVIVIIITFTITITIIIIMIIIIIITITSKHKIIKK